MFRTISLLASASVLVLAQSASAQDLAADAKAFGAREAVDAPDLAADGERVLYLTPAAGRKTSAVIVNVMNGAAQVAASSDGEPEALRWCNFTAAQRLVCRVTGNVNTAGYLVGFGRLLALDTNGGNPKLLGQTGTRHDARLRQNDGTIIDWLDGTTGDVLMSREYVPEEGKIGTNIISKKDGLGVDRVDTASARAKPVEPPKDGASLYMSDGRGNVRLMGSLEYGPGKQLTGRMKYWYRTRGSRDWRTLVDYQEDEFEPLAIDAGLDALYALKKKGGRWALHSIRLDGSLATSLIAENARVDVDDVVRFGDGQRVIGYTFAEEKRKIVYFDPEFRSLSAALSKALPTLPIVNFVDSSADGRRLLIFAGGDTDPGRYYLFDRDKKSLTEAMFARPELKGRTLAQVKPVAIPGPGGVSIPAYLTLPPGKDVKNLPAVVLPHGGPSARDEWGFDWLSQFLAARGYAVLQPNYRGSAGFGDAWLNENGFKGWRTSIGDISASARWLASEGIANPQRLAIVGWSYGGYAALQSAATEPALYKSVVAIAPVTDLSMLKQDAVGYTSENLVAKFVGSGAHVSAGSPLRNVRSITAPVLLVHGDLDVNVFIGHSKAMHDALRDAGKQSELITYRGLDHYLDDSAARTEMLTRIGALLERTIGR